MAETKNKMSIRKKVACFIIPLVTVPVIARIILYFYILIKGFGQYALPNYATIFVNILMYSSIFKYSIDYFVKSKDVSLDSLIFRYGISILVMLFNFKNADNIIFILTAIIVFLAPYLSASIHSKKNTKVLNFVLLFGILILSFALSFILIDNPVDTYVTFLGRNIYNLDSLNTFIEWLLFATLVIARVIVMVKELKNDKK